MWTPFSALVVVGALVVVASGADIAQDTNGALVLESNDVIFKKDGSTVTNLSDIQTTMNTNKEDVKKVRDRIDREVSAPISELQELAQHIHDDVDEVYDILGGRPVDEDGNPISNATLTERIDDILGQLLLSTKRDSLQEGILNTLVDLASPGVGRITVPSWTGVQQGEHITNNASTVLVMARDVIPHDTASYECVFDNNGKTQPSTTGKATSAYTIDCPSPIITNPTAQKFKIQLIKVTEVRGAVRTSLEFKGTTASQMVDMMAAAPSVSSSNSVYTWGSSDAQLKIEVQVDDPDHSTSDLTIKVTSPDISGGSIAISDDNGKTGKKTITLSSKPSKDTKITVTITDKHATTSLDIMVVLECPTIKSTEQYALIAAADDKRSYLLHCLKGINTDGENVAVNYARVVSTSEPYRELNTLDKMFEGKQINDLNNDDRFLALCYGTCYWVVDLGKPYTIDAIRGWNGHNGDFGQQISDHSFQIWKPSSNNYAGSFPPTSDSELRNMMVYDDGWETIPETVSGPKGTFLYTFSPKTVQYVRMELSGGGFFRLYEVQFWQNFRSDEIECNDGQWDESTCPA